MYSTGDFSNGDFHRREKRRQSVSETSSRAVQRRIGAFRGQHYEKYLKKIVRNTEPVDWKSRDLRYLLKVKRTVWKGRSTRLVLVQDQYDPMFQSKIDACPPISLSELTQLKSETSCAQIRYSNTKEFVAIADTLGIMNDLKSNVPRTAYQGVVQCRFGSATIFVRPSQRPWKGYE